MQINLTIAVTKANFKFLEYWGLAQLGERLDGIQEVGGSIPPSSTNILPQFSPPIFSLL